jgi:cytochrome b6-f complex iron-sulfur subunit
MVDKSRRRFLNWFLGTSMGAAFVSVLYPVARFLSPPSVPEASVFQIEAGATNEPEFLERGFKIIRFGSEPVIVIRLAEREFRAFAGTCTHLDCIVEYQKEPGQIWCNCHNGGYDLAGRNTVGPPPKPLETFKVDLVENGSDQPVKVIVSRT